MSDATATLARAITWTGSKQTYYTARLMVDKDLVDDFFRAYAYFRWVDDIIDKPPSEDYPIKSDQESSAFIRRQKELIDTLYQNGRAADLIPEEEIVADLICHDRGENSGLQSFIRNMLAIIEFDAQRKGMPVSGHQLTWYTAHVAKSVTDGIEYFIGHHSTYPESDWRYSAAIAAHITHLLRDMVADMADGFINIPLEYLEATGIRPDEFDSPTFRAWVRERVDQARIYFREGKRYLNQLEVLRCKIVGHWYCARFESVLDTIEQDDYHLRPRYEERRNLSTWIRIAWLGLVVTFQHLLGRRRGERSGPRRNVRLSE